MGLYAKRMAATQTESQPVTGDSASSLVITDNNPVAVRAKMIIGHLLAQRSVQKHAAGKIMSKIIAEAINDMSEVPPVVLELYMTQLSAVCFWVAKGERPPDIPWPDDFQPEAKK